jgi:hypothetical protein
MPDSTYVIVTLLPRYRRLTNQVAGEPKKYLVEVSDYGIKNAGASETELAIRAAISADNARYGSDPIDITRDIDSQVTVVSPDKKLPDDPYEFENCRVWPITA